MHSARRQPAIDIGGLWVRRTRFHEPTMQDPSKDADGLPQKGFAKKRRTRSGKKRQRTTVDAEKGQSSLVNTGFRALSSSEREKRREDEGLRGQAVGANREEEDE